MRWILLASLLACCDKAEPRAVEIRPEITAPTPAPVAPKPADEMDEKMRHCPLAIEGATTELVDVETGIRLDVKAPAPKIEEVRRRAHHLVDFAAKRHVKGTHGAFDGKGGGRMKNCPVVTDDVTIAVEDTFEGVRISVITTADRVAKLQLESRERAAKFPFVGATITGLTAGK